MRTGAGLFAGMLMGVALQAQAGIGTFPQNPGFGAPSYSQTDIDNAYSSGRDAGRTEASAECLANPANCGCNYQISPCGTTVTSLLAPYKFGEIEPNDHLIGATGLISEISYWGQSRSLDDQDWFYVTTQEPNQVLTLNFTVPNRVLEDTSRLSQGWLVQVRDAAGNVYAQFDTRYALDDPLTTSKNESREITYTVFVGHVGTYYVVVQPQIVDQGSNTLITQAMVDDNSVNRNDLSVLYSPYNLAAILTFSAMDASPPDVNFHDVEIEPNDSTETANRVTTGVTMKGMLRQTSDTVNPTDSTFYQTDVDWFVYESPGMEQINLGWCGREACTADTVWFVEVQKADGTPIASFNTDKAQTVNFGLAAAGKYYIQVRFQRTLDAVCATYATTPSCLAKSYACQVLAVNTTPDPDTCSYGAGNTCGTGAAGAGSAPCVLAGTAAAASHPLWQWLETCTTYGLACTSYTSTINTNALNVQYNFTWWGTKLLPNTYGSDAFTNFLTRPAWYQDR